MTSFTDVFLALHSARRALYLARQAQQNDALAGGKRPVFDDVVLALAHEVEHRERAAADLVGVGITIPETGARVVVEIEDRRKGVRPRFIYKHGRVPVVCECSTCNGRVVA